MWRPMKPARVFWMPVLLLMLLVVACGDGDTEAEADASLDDGAAAALAAAVEQLIRVDHTFGDGPPPFSEYLLQSRIDPAAGNAGVGPGVVSRALTDAERDAIAGVVAAFGPLR